MLVCRWSISFHPERKSFMAVYDFLFSCHSHGFIWYTGLFTSIDPSLKLDSLSASVSRDPQTQFSVLQMQTSMLLKKEGRKLQRRRSFPFFWQPKALHNIPTWYARHRSLEYIIKTEPDASLFVCLKRKSFGWWIDIFFVWWWGRLLWFVEHIDGSSNSHVDSSFRPWIIISCSLENILFQP